jgi:hypothetical protein
MKDLSKKKSVPADPKLYAKVKKQVYKKYPKHSAYRSGLLVQKYKSEYKKKFPGKSPYKGKKPTVESGGLRRWFAEDWKSDTGKYKYTSKSSVYRPTKRISSKTPTTFNELSDKEIKRAKKEKSKTGRVKKFKVK